MTAIRLLPLVGIVVTSLAAAAGTDELWEVSSKMTGMPGGYQMPEQVHRVCVPQGKGYESASGSGEKNKDCKIADLKTSGSHTSYRMECTGKNAMSGSMDMERTGPDAYKGTMKMNSQGMAMTMAYAGKKVGSCTYEDPLAKLGKAK